MGDVPVELEAEADPEAGQEAVADLEPKNELEKYWNSVKFRQRVWNGHGTWSRRWRKWANMQNNILQPNNIKDRSNRGLFDTLLLLLSVPLDLAETRSEGLAHFCVIPVQ